MRRNAAAKDRARKKNRVILALVKISAATGATGPSASAKRASKRACASATKTSAEDGKRLPSARNAKTELALMAPATNQTVVGQNGAHGPTATRRAAVMERACARATAIARTSAARTSGTKDVLGMPLRRNLA